MDRASLPLPKTYSLPGEGSQVHRYWDVAKSSHDVTAVFLECRDTQKQDNHVPWFELDTPHMLNLIGFRVLLVKYGWRNKASIRTIDALRVGRPFFLACEFTAQEVVYFMSQQWRDVAGAILLLPEYEDYAMSDFNCAVGSGKLNTDVNRLARTKFEKLFKGMRKMPRTTCVTTPVLTFDGDLHVLLIPNSDYQPLNVSAKDIVRKKDYLNRIVYNFALKLLEVEKALTPAVKRFITVPPPKVATRAAITGRTIPKPKKSAATSTQRALLACTLSLACSVTVLIWLHAG